MSETDSLIVYQDHLNHHLIHYSPTCGFVTLCDVCGKISEPGPFEQGCTLWTKCSYSRCASKVARSNKCGTTILTLGWWARERFTVPINLLWLSIFVLILSCQLFYFLLIYLAYNIIYLSILVFKKAYYLALNREARKLGPLKNSSENDIF
jgi:hypothetical protein